MAAADHRQPRRAPARAESAAHALPFFSQRPGDTAVLLRGSSDGDLHVLTGGDASIAVHAVLRDVGVGQGELLIDRDALARALDERPTDNVIVPVDDIEIFASIRFHPPLDEPAPTAARIEAERFAVEAARVLPVSGSVGDHPRRYGMRVWFEQDAIVLQAASNTSTAVVRLPAEVAEAAVGQSVMIVPCAVKGFLEGRQGNMVEIELGHEYSRRWVTLRDDGLSVSAWEPAAREIPWQGQLFSRPAVSATVDLDALRQAISGASRSPRTDVLQAQTPVVHLSAHPVRVSWRNDDDPDPGPVVVARRVDLKHVVKLFTTEQLTFHMETDDSRSPVIVTEAGAELGAVTTPHVLLAQGSDPRPSQRPRRLRPLVDRNYPDCALRPLGLAALAETLRPDGVMRAADYDACVREDEDCRACPFLHRLRYEPYVPPLPGHRLIVEARPDASDASKPVPWLIAAEQSDTAEPVRTTWENLAALGAGWRVESVTDEHLVLVRDPRFSR